MTDNEIIIEVARLDGKVSCNKWKPAFHPLMGLQKDCEHNNCYPEGKEEWLKYPTSRDAIVPVIEKQSTAKFRIRFGYALWDVMKISEQIESDTWLAVIKATPRQLCEALLRTTGKWKE